jgi:hypothetical protein
MTNTTFPNPIPEEIHAKQASKRNALDDLDMVIANLSIPAYYSPHKNHMPISVDKTVIDADTLLQLTAADFIFKIGEIYAEEKCNPTDLYFEQGGRWEDIYVDVCLKVDRLENDKERQDRWDAELAAHNEFWKKESDRLMKQHTNTHMSLVRNLNNLVEAELRITGDDQQTIKDAALAKLTETERRALGIE